MIGAHPRWSKTLTPLGPCAIRAAPSTPESSQVAVLPPQCRATIQGGHHHALGRYFWAELRLLLSEHSIGSSEDFPLDDQVGDVARVGEDNAHRHEQVDSTLATPTKATMREAPPRHVEA